MRATLLLGLACSLPALAPAALSGCSAAPPQPPAARPRSGSLVPAEPGLVDRDWGILRFKAQGIKLALPEARAWLEPLARAPAGAGWELRHEPTGTTLSVRRWRASRLPRIDACEAELRERTADLAVADETNLVSRREVRVPEGFLTRITLLALPTGTTRLRGQALAVGAGVGECLAAVARTECATEAELAERLRLLDVALGHVRLNHVEDRVPVPQLPTH